MTHTSDTAEELTDEMLEQVVGGVETDWASIEAAFGPVIGTSSVDEISAGMSGDTVGNDLIVNQAL